MSASTFAHQGNLNQIPWVACEEKSLNDACEFYNSKQDVFRGSCQSMSDVLMCVRNQPIEYAVENAQEESNHDHSDAHNHTEDTQADGHSH